MKWNAKTRLAIRIALYVLFALVMAEATARVFWAMQGLSFAGCHRRFIEHFYPKVREIDKGRDDGNAENFDILILGGSVVNSRFGPIPALLAERLTRRTGRRIRIYNLADLSQTTLDSLYKYRHLRNLPFDLVMVYHGINDVRMNNCTREQFRDDYSHYLWYKLLNAAERGADSRLLALPYTLYFACIVASDQLGLVKYQPRDVPDPLLLRYGKDLKSLRPFEHNMRALLELARSKDEKVVLMTFASYQVDHYRRDRFNRREFDYTLHLYATDFWGLPDNVVAGVNGHNEIVRRLAKDDPGVVFVDQNALIPKQGLYFNDICHLTVEGCEQFVENLMEPLTDLIEKTPHRIARP